MNLEGRIAKAIHDENERLRIGDSKSSGPEPYEMLTKQQEVWHRRTRSWCARESKENQMTEISTVARLRYTGSESGLTVGDIRAFCEMIDDCDDTERLEVTGAACFEIEAVILLADREE